MGCWSLTSRALVLCIFAVFSDIIGYSIHVPFVPGHFEENYGITGFLLGLLFASYSLSAVLVSLPVSAVIQKHDALFKVLLLGPVLMVGSSVLLMVIPADADSGLAFALYVAGRSVMGISSSCTWVVCLTILNDVFAGEEDSAKKEEKEGVVAVDTEKGKDMKTGGKSEQERGAVGSDEMEGRPSMSVAAAFGMVLSTGALGIIMGPFFGGLLYDLGGYVWPWVFLIALNVIDFLVRAHYTYVVVPSTDPAFFPISYTRGGRRGPASATSSTTSQSPEQLEAGSVSPAPLLRAEDPEEGEDVTAAAEKETEPQTEPETGAVVSQGDQAEHEGAIVASPRGDGGFYKDNETLLISLVTILNGVSFASLEPVLPVHLEEEYDSSPTIIGVVYVVQAVGFILGSTISSFVYDPLAKKLSMANAYRVNIVLISVAYVLVAFAGELWQLFCCVFLVGMFTAVLLHPTVPDLQKLAARHNLHASLTQVYALWNMFNLLGLFIAPIVASSVYNATDFKTNGLILAAIMLGTYNGADLMLRVINPNGRKPLTLNPNATGF
jgi:MFS family permease